MNASKRELKTKRDSTKDLEDLKQENNRIRLLHQENIATKQAIANDLKKSNEQQ